MEAPPIETDVKLEPADLVALHRRVAKRSKAASVTVVLLIVSFFTAALACGLIYPHANYLPGFFMVYAGLILYIILRLAFRDVIYRKIYGEDSYAFESRHYVFDARGIRITTAHSESTASWKAISMIDRTKAHILLLLPGNNQGYIIPFRALPPALKPDEAFQRLSGWHKQAGAG